MDVKSAEKSFQHITYGDESYQNLLDHLPDISQNSFHLCLFVGETVEPKQKALQQIADKVNREIYRVDANDVISKNESEAYKNLEHVFENFSPDTSLLYIENGARFSGSYTGYTNSRIKYATPQERYFFNKMQEKGGLYIFDLDDTVDGDTTLHRAAESIVSFPAPQSGLKKLMWKLKHITFNGSHIQTRRPERYGRQAGNF